VIVMVGWPAPRPRRNLVAQGVDALDGAAEPDQVWQATAGT
jgi:hypothetical protein